MDVTLAHHVRADLAEARQDAEARMLDTVTVRRTSGRPDTQTGAGQTATVYTGPARIVDTQAIVTQVDAAAAGVVLQRLEVRLPATAGPFRVNDVVDVDACPTFPDLVGRHFRLTRRPAGSQSAQQRVPAEEMS